MTYNEFLSILCSKNLLLQEVAPLFGYNLQSIQNNWSKNDKVPDKAEIMLQLYLELLEAKEENLNLQKNIENISNTSNKLLTQEALEIATTKCKMANISLDNYLSSLVISSL